ncbi:MAG: alpha/beta hydrolase fold containing protein [Bacteroidota bacterium]|nr:alpha/beta hydrolase fold containing protein [Bacteroidota bacterium]
MFKKILKAIGVLLLLFVVGSLTQLHLDIPVEELKAEYAPSPSKFINIDGLLVHYRDEGKGYPVVLIHGMSSSFHTWQVWADSLSKQYRVIRMDIPCFGLTGPNADNIYDAAYYVSFMQKLLDSLGVKECYMAGSSLGGFITWQYAASHPQQVKKMILVDAAGYPIAKPPFIFTLGKIKLLGLIGRYITPRYLVEKSTKEVYGDPTKVSDVIVERYFKLSLRDGNRAGFIAFVNRIKNYDTESLRHINIPTLIQWGEKDHWISLEHAGKFHNDIKGSKLIVYAGVGHIPMEEEPTASVKDAMQFFAEKDTSERAK